MPVMTRRRVAAVKAGERSAIKPTACTGATRSTATPAKPRKATTKDPKAKPKTKAKGRSRKPDGPISPGLPGHRLYQGRATLGDRTVVSPTWKKKIKRMIRELEDALAELDET